MLLYLLAGLVAVIVLALATFGAWMLWCLAVAFSRPGGLG